LKAPGFQPLNLKCDLLVSNFAFKCNVYRYYTEAWYMFVSNQDRGMCAHPGLRNMLPDKSVVLSSFGLYSIDDLECFYPDRDIVLPAYKKDLGAAKPEFYREESKNQPDSALLFFAGTLKGVSPRWGCTRLIQLKHSLKAPGFNP
jgi:hypothetical protein